jgi:hypothetical protein
MKTIIKKSLIIFSTCLLFNGNNIMASNEATPTKKIVNTSTLIKEHLFFPSLKINAGNEQKVNVVFTVDELGQINLVIANSKNELLKQSIEAQFKKLTLKNLEPNNAYSIILNFKTI